MYVTGWHRLKLGCWENGSLIGRLPSHAPLHAASNETSYLCRVTHNNLSDSAKKNRYLLTLLYSPFHMAQTTLDVSNVWPHSFCVVLLKNKKKIKKWIKSGANIKFNAIFKSTNGAWWQKCNFELVSLLICLLVFQSSYLMLPLLLPSPFKIWGYPLGCYEMKP